MKRTKISTVHGQPIPDVNNSFTKEMRSDRATAKTLVYFKLMVVDISEKSFLFKCKVSTAALIDHWVFDWVCCLWWCCRQRRWMTWDMWMMMEYSQLIENPVVFPVVFPWMITVMVPRYQQKLPTATIKFVFFIFLFASYLYSAVSASQCLIVFWQSNFQEFLTRYCLCFLFLIKVRIIVIYLMVKWLYFLQSLFKLGAV